jgi:hypothetical protein
MIRITCTHCRQVLTIDEGFAGGVCRCQNCGTIQTVPAGKSSARTGAGPPRTLYRAGDQTGQPGSREGPLSHEHPVSDATLAELAEIVSSSGLRSNSRRLRQPLPMGGGGQKISLPPQPPRSHTFALIAAGVVIVLLLAVIALLLSHGSSSQAVPAPPGPVAGAVANFAGMPLEAEDTVVYLLDNGGSAGDALPAMEAACFQSIRSLGPSRRFKVIFWAAGSPVYPADGTVRATPDEEAKCQAALRTATPQPDAAIDPAFRLALAAQADAVVLVTPRAAQLPGDFAQIIQSLRGASRVRVYTVGINGDSTADAAKIGSLATVAAQSGAQFLNISTPDLLRLAHQPE